jgi:DNA polymerase III delta subunit
MIILHGENTVLSRQRLKEEIETFKEKSKGEVLKFEAQNLTLVDFQQAIESPSLISNERLVILEGLFGGRKNNQKEKILGYLKKNNPENLIIWEGKKIDGRTLLSFKAKVFKFDLPLVIFRFLDSLFPGNSRNSLELFHQCLEQDPPELIFFLMARQFRMLILAVDLGQEGLPKMQNWQIGKLIHQGQKFGLQPLLALYKELLKIDWQQKTGQTPFNLVSQLDLFLASF